MGRFKNADHKVVVNLSCSRLSFAIFQNWAPDAIGYPLQIRDGEKTITFAKMYRKKVSKDLELARLKKLAKEKELKDAEKAKLEAKPIEEIFAQEFRVVSMFLV
ncbi:hypothetical protein M9H77_03663 [Catharanthus roseus]|uniref:Uncharacterized protein n=1 Tax=Catharanthus roseus TaxID=4058 RepID=A0ACC0CC16_CATRO|nr:hypothetical protein M9H77_03663 [Catharanthus roseus]